VRIAALAALAIGNLAQPAVAQGGPLAITVSVERLSWQGTGEVYPPGRTLKIGLRTAIDPVGNVVSETWPLELGEAKGLRRMRIANGQGTIERGGKSQPMPEGMRTEEQEQFDFYRYLQLAAKRAPQMAALGVNTFQIPETSLTWFRTDRDGTITGAVNEVNAVGGTAYQEFRFKGFWKSSESVFPKHMEMFRAGQRYFILDVTRFDAG
jgi:hypothetical protein